eukprot:g83353.t1
MLEYWAKFARLASPVYELVRATSSYPSREGDDAALKMFSQHELEPEDFLFSNSLSTWYSRVIGLSTIQLLIFLQWQ